MSKQTLIHIGYHKTGTTWLQKHLLDNPDAKFKRYFSKQDIRDYIVVPNSLSFEANETQEYYNSLLKQEDSSELVSVVSSERLSGHPHSGGYDSKEIAIRLKQVFPNGKVLIVIREQKSAISSCYLQYIKFGGPCSLKDYITPTKKGLPVIPLFNFDHFNYLKLIDQYLELFGKENVLVLAYEQFKENPQSFCSQVSSFAGAQELETLPFSKVTNQRISPLSSNIARQLNKLLVKTTLNPSALNLMDSPELLMKSFIFLDRLIPKTIHKIFESKQKVFIKNNVGDRYKTSNQQLSEKLGIDLAAYGYDT